MNLTEIKAAIEAKTLEFEAALEGQRPHSELRKLYIELKELKYQLVQAELNESLTESTE